jgi:uncharacterized coiled-coil protein SlyX
VTELVEFKILTNDKIEGLERRLPIGNYVTDDPEEIRILRSNAIAVDVEEEYIMLMNGITSNLKELDERIKSLEIRLAVVEREHDLQVISAEKALNKAEHSMSTRLDGMNEFRNQLKDQTATFITNNVFDARYRALEIKIEAIQKIVWGAMAIISLLTFAVPLFLKFL